jgi:hypothetical protein
MSEARTDGGDPGGDRHGGPPGRRPLRRRPRFGAEVTSGRGRRATTRAHPPRCSACGSSGSPATRDVPTATASPLGDGRGAGTAVAAHRSRGSHLREGAGSREASGRGPQASYRRSETGGGEAGGRGARRSQVPRGRRRSRDSRARRSCPRSRSGARGRTEGTRRCRGAGGRPTGSRGARWQQVQAPGRSASVGSQGVRPRRALRGRPQTGGPPSGGRGRRGPGSRPRAQTTRTGTRGARRRVLHARCTEGRHEAGATRRRRSLHGEALGPRPWTSPRFAPTSGPDATPSGVVKSHPRGGCRSERSTRSAARGGPETRREAHARRSGGTPQRRLRRCDNPEAQEGVTKEARKRADV